MDKFELAGRISDFIEEQIENSDIELGDAISATAATLAAFALSSAQEGRDRDAVMAAVALTLRHGLMMIENGGGDESFVQRSH